LRTDEDRFGKAFSVFAQDRIYLTRAVILTPGLRLERYRYTRQIQRAPVQGVPTDVNRRASDLVTKLVPGLGLAVNASSRLTLFTGLHRGFAPPRTKDAITSGGVPLDLDAELSWNYEAGVRYKPSRAVSGEVTFFRMDFENQIIPAAQSGGATTTLVNAGETLHQGLESSVRLDWGELTHSPLSLYTDFRYTYLPTARFTRDALYLGNRLPYAPRNIFGFLLGFRSRQGLGLELDASLVGEQFGDNNMTVTPSADGTIGLLPRYAVWNLTADYTHRRERVSITPYLAVKNLGNEVYVSSRAPQGIQPGLFRQVNAGLKFTF
jgi:Fe(3+) dicitrate transport protein